MGEKPYQLLDHTRQQIDAKPGRTRKEDYEYCRERGVFLMHVVRTAGRQTSRQRPTPVHPVGLLHEIQTLLTIDYPEVEKLALVTDNLKTRTVWSLYEAFPAVTTRELASRLEIHYTPKHGS